MNILLAPDKFKGSLSAQGVCDALTKGLKATQPSCNITSRPLADGGDGSLAILDHYFDLRTYTKRVQDPLGRSISASYKMADKAAYIEMSAASGLVLLKPEERNCMKTSSFGTGELIEDARAKGATEIFLFIGGSATNDGAIGIAEALGYRFYNKSGKRLAPIGENLRDIHKIEAGKVSDKLQRLKIKVICDVNNPFYGPTGAAHVYAAQKGASEEEIELLDAGLRNLAICLEAVGYPDIANIPGAGAAGGVGGGSIAFLGAELVSGIQTFLGISRLEEWVKKSDLIITGEGKLDAQTAHGKVVSGVCLLAQKHGIPVLAVCGIAEEGLAEKLSLKKIYSVMNRSNSVEEAMTTAAEKLEEIGREISRDWDIPYK